MAGGEGHTGQSMEAEGPCNCLNLGGEGEGLGMADAQDSVQMDTGDSH